jgi:ACS family hexuronate transporter-like MFS transporter
MHTNALAATTTGGYRWRILALLFAATTINYLDRSIIGVLAPTLQYRVFQWSDMDYANINIAFKLAYAIGMLTMGAIIDRFGTRIGYTVSIAVWSLFGMLHAAVRPAFSVMGFILCRFGLGFGESGNFPAAQKAVAEWFPKKERALATGIYNAGTNVGAILAPLLIPLVVSANGNNWQLAFLMTGAFSAIWVITWLSMYKRPEVHPKVSKNEVDFILSDHVAETVEKLPWRKVIFVKETWAFAAAKMTDAVWWFYLFWGGKFLFDQFGLNIKKLALPLIIIYVVADVGSVGGGWLSSFFIKRGWTINRARKTTLLLCALFILPVVFVTQVPTRFNTDEAFFSKLAAETYTSEVIGDDGSVVKTEKNISPEQMARLRTLEGQSYANAKTFITAAREAVGKEEANQMEALLMDSARSDSYYWIAVWLIALAAAGHQAWSANVFTLVSDVFPKKATASVTGIGGMVGALSGLLADLTLGNALSASGPEGYFFAFLIAGLAYITVLGIVHLIMPKMTPLNEDLKPVS